MKYSLITLFTQLEVFHLPKVDYELSVCDNAVKTVNVNLLESFVVIITNTEPADLYVVEQMEAFCNEMTIIDAREWILNVKSVFANHKVNHSVQSIKHSSNT